MAGFTTTAIILAIAAASSAAVASRSAAKKQAAADAAALNRTGADGGAARATVGSAVPRNQDPATLARIAQQKARALERAPGRVNPDNLLISGEAEPLAGPAPPPSAAAASSLGYSMARGASDKARKRAAAGGAVLSRAYAGKTGPQAKLQPLTLIGS